MTNLLSKIVRLFHTPVGGLVPTEWPHPSDVYTCMRARLDRVRRGEASIEQDDLDYWGERFVRLRVRHWTGCTFRRYLLFPEHWEGIARARAHAHARRQAVRAGGRVGFRISHS